MEVGERKRPRISFWQGAISISAQPGHHQGDGQGCKRPQEVPEILTRADLVQPWPYRLILRLRQIEVDHQHAATQHDQASRPAVVAGIAVLERIKATDAQSALAIPSEAETLNGDGIVEQQQAF